MIIVYYYAHTHYMHHLTYREWIAATISALLGTVGLALLVFWE